MFIKQLNKKQVTTKYGEKEKWNVLAEDGKWYDAWMGKWNADWKEGDTINVPVERIKSREYNGKTYYSIEAPPEARFNGGAKVDLEPVMEALRKLYAKLNNIDNQLLFMKSIVLGKSESKQPEVTLDEIDKAFGVDESTMPNF